MSIREFLSSVFMLALWLYRFLRSARHKRSKIRPYARKKIILAGNGPSISSFDFLNEKIAGYDVLCVNNFAPHHPEFFKIKPRFYCIIDPFFFDAKIASERGFSQMQEDFMVCMKKVDWKMTVILQSNQAIDLQNDNIDYIYLNTNVYEGALFRSFLYSRNLACSTHYNVINAALYFAVTAKYEEIYLIGAELNKIKDYRVNDEGNIIDSAKHFTAGMNMVNCIPKGMFCLHMFGYYKALNCFSIYNQYASSMNIKVFNSTPQSFIDVFERKEL